MQGLRLHHYGFLTASTSDWLLEQELFVGKPYRVSETITVHTQKVKVTFVEQTEGAVLTELVEPLPGNTSLEKMLSKGITVYHCGYLTLQFDEKLSKWEAAGGRLLQTFHSEAFGGRRCAFMLTTQLGLVELIEGEEAFKV